MNRWALTEHDGQPEQIGVLHALETHLFGHTGEQLSEATLGLKQTDRQAVSQYR